MAQIIPGPLHIYSIMRRDDIDGAKLPVSVDKMTT